MAEGYGLYTERLGNAFGGNGFRTNAEVNRALGENFPIYYMQYSDGSLLTFFSLSVAVSSGSGRTFGWGVTGGASAAIGLVGGGFVDVNVSAGQFLNGNSVTNGAAISGGGSVGLPSRSGEVGNTSAPAPLPNSYPTVIGRSAGLGAGLFFTNAGSVEQLRGPFYTQQLSTPLVSFQYDSDSSGTRVLSITFGPSLGASYFRGTTTTYTTPSLPGTPIGGTPIYVPRR